MIEPALTAEEWNEPDHRVEREGFWVYEPDGTVPVVGEGRYGTSIGTMRHAVAALALYGQPFGFSRDDVEELREAASTLAAGNHAMGNEGDALLNLADRIEALLPPESAT